MSEKKSYKESLNLPQTSFAMEAKLVVNEPLRLEKWIKGDLYGRIMAARKAAPRWVLHDGPPYANGDIHIGHVLNKTLKDVLLRFRTMQGRQTPYVPGFDCHGLPIEQRIQQDIGPQFRQLAALHVRKLCGDYAEEYVRIQSRQFQRLGILGQWNEAYLTMRGSYEAHCLEVFAQFVEKSLVYKKLKPVAWSIENQTALAEAELEYQDVSDQSVFVEFPIEGKPAEFLLVWTTTPWTLPANLAVSVHPEVEYACVEYERGGEVRHAIVASPLFQEVFKAAKVGGFPRIIATIRGTDLRGIHYRHPFIDDGPSRRVVLAPYVTTTDGTGLVHNAPGHGEEDYEVALRENLKIYCPVLASGRFDDTVPEWLRGKTTREANPLIVEKLRALGLLFAEQTITHSYPHDWRSKKPIIFRATEQWFIEMDRPFASGDGSSKSLRERALQAVGQSIQFVPQWGQARLLGMLQSRPDWCISRQRAWGLPIPVFYNEQGQPLLTPQSVRAVARQFAEHGSDAWFTLSPPQLLADYDPGPQFPKDKLRKEKDIFDVWFESGSSWQAVLRQRPNLGFPADLYLEGSDQHRGWFQTSLLLALGVMGQPPYKQVVTNGFIVKPDGTKVSKSDKEYVTATQEIDRHGADLLRLWCCSVDYQGDVPTSPEILRKFGDKYRKIRNTLRFLLSNLYAFNPAAGEITVPPSSLDAWALAQLDGLIRDVTAAYDAYQLHVAFRLLHDFCAVQISAMYGNASKDRLYCEKPDSPLRRRSQSVMHKMAVALTKLLAPMIVFTADEVWEHLPHKDAADASCDCVHLALLPKSSALPPTPQQQEDWTLLMSLRNDVLGQLDTLTRQIGKYKALDAEVVYETSNAELRSRLQAFGPDLEDVVSAGHHRWSDAVAAAEPGALVRVTLVDTRDKYASCARCWKRRPDVGSDLQKPDLCTRCAAAV